jgi:hypothetical protein
LLTGSPHITDDTLLNEGLAPGRRGFNRRGL